MMGQQEPGGQQAGDDPVSASGDERLIHNVASGPSPTWQSPGAAGPQTVSVSSRWPLAIISIFCFWPLGIAACVFAAKVKPALRAGDVATARNASNRVKLFFEYSLAIFVLFLFIAITRR